MTMKTEAVMCNQLKLGRKKNNKFFYKQNRHWYRQNPDGTWSHKKPGITVRNFDTSGQVIYDPQECDRNYTAYGKEYDVFLGYYAVYPLSSS